ncbi:MAG: methionine adenosyltransferase [Bacteroidales bacterium]|nr:methionine adenosyltransferase [Bacteroidales bacterium]
MSYYFTSESVSEGHPDKVADQISDAILDELLKQDPDSKCACETLVTTGLCIVGGEVKTNAYVDVQTIARHVIRRIGYTKPEYKFDADSCGVLTSIQEQSPDINQGVEREDPENQGAGDQGMMFGYASKQTENLMPLPVDIAHKLVAELARIRRKDGLMPYLCPDSKSQVTLEYDDDGNPLRIDTIVVSTQHEEFIKPEYDTAEASEKAEKEMLSKIETDIINILIPRVKEQYPKEIQKFFDKDFRLFVNPTGKFVIGGPHGDTGLTGRKIIVDTYGGRGAHGGGAFSGKDASKVDRSAAYAARHIAKNLVAADICDEAEVQLAYAIGVAEPVGIYVRTAGKKVKHSDSELSEIVNDIFDLRPFAIIQRFGLKNPIFEETAAYGHMGRQPAKKIVFKNNEHKEVELFTWEKTNYVDKLKEAL